MTRWDTSMGGRDRRFPATRWSVVARAKDSAQPESREALDELCRQYWKPVYAYIRSARSYSNDEAKDLTQQFFVDVVDGSFLERFSSDRGSFRAYLRGAIHLFLLERHQKDAALKRGGGRKFLTLDDGEVARVYAAPGVAPETAFDHQWAKSVVDLAIDDLREELVRSGKEVYFRVFDRYELHPSAGDSSTYGDMAKEFGIKETDVGNYLQHAKRRLRALIVDRVRDYVEDANDVAEELNQIFSLLTK